MNTTPLADEEGWWEELPATPGTVVDVSVGNDGTLVAATSTGLYLWAAPGWELIAEPHGGPFTSVSVGDCLHIMAVMAWTTIHYYRSGSTWSAVVLDIDALVKAASTTSDGVVYGILDGQDAVMMYHSLNSYTTTTTTPVRGVSAAGSDLVYATLDEDVDPEPRTVQVTWLAQTLVTTGLTQVSTGSDGTIWGVNGLGGVFRTSTAERPMTWVEVPSPSLEKVSVGSRLHVVGLAANRLYRYQPEGAFPIPLIDFSEPEYESLYMAGSFAEWAYALQPLEAGWLGSPGRGIERELAGTQWTVKAYYNDPDTSTQAYMVYSMARAEIVLAFRGSQELRDFYHDVTWYAELAAITVSSDVMVPWPVLAGWRNLRDAVIADLEAVVTALGGPSGVKALYVTGHSLGAALATYAAYDLAITKELAGVSPQAVTVFAYASPPVGNPAFAASYEKLGLRTYRVLEPRDWIIGASAYLLSYLGYQQVGKLVALAPGRGHGVANYLELIARAFTNASIFGGYLRAGAARSSTGAARSHYPPVRREA